MELLLAVTYGDASVDVRVDADGGVRIDELARSLRKFVEVSLEARRNNRSA